MGPSRPAGQRPSKPIQLFHRLPAAPRAAALPPTPVAGVPSPRCFAALHPCHRQCHLAHTTRGPHPRYDTAHRAPLQPSQRSVRARSEPIVESPRSPAHLPHQKSAGTDLLLALSPGKLGAVPRTSVLRDRAPQHRCVDPSGSVLSPAALGTTHSRASHPWGSCPSKAQRRNPRPTPLKPGRHFTASTAFGGHRGVHGPTRSVVAFARRSLASRIGNDTGT